MIYLWIYCLWIYCFGCLSCYVLFILYKAKNHGEVTLCDALEAFIPSLFSFIGLFGLLLVIAEDNEIVLWRKK